MTDTADQQRLETAVLDYLRGHLLGYLLTGKPAITPEKGSEGRWNYRFLHRNTTVYVGTVTERDGVLSVHEHGSEGVSFASLPDRMPTTISAAIRRDLRAMSQTPGSPLHGARVSVRLRDINPHITITLPGASPEAAKAADEAAQLAAYSYNRRFTLSTHHMLFTVVVRVVTDERP